MCTFPICFNQNVDRRSTEPQLHCTASLIDIIQMPFQSQPLGLTGSSNWPRAHPAQGHKSMTSSHFKEQAQDQAAGDFMKLVCS